MGERLSRRYSIAGRLASILRMVHTGGPHTHSQKNADEALLD